MPDDHFKRLDRFPALTTARLLLRQVTLDDAEWYLEHFSVPEIVRGQGCAAPEGVDAAREQVTRYFVESFEQRRGMRWGLVLKEDLAHAGAPDAGAPLIGSAGFYDWDGEVCSAEFGYDLRPEYWGRGLMAEALTAILDFVFGSLGLNRAQIILMPRNRRSRRLAERLGFTEEGTLREHDVDERGELCDDVVFSLLAREWRERTA
ncbi:MAG: N-acetyltransferase [Actinomycetota bacterium]|nr:MAG: N-acetyltransferase [Actinomycetota bacterium]